MASPTLLSLAADVAALATKQADNETRIVALEARMAAVEKSVATNVGNLARFQDELIQVRWDVNQRGRR